MNKIQYQTLCKVQLQIMVFILDYCWMSIMNDFCVFSALHCVAIHSFSPSFVVFFHSSARCRFISSRYFCRMNKRINNFLCENNASIDHAVVYFGIAPLLSKCSLLCTELRKYLAAFVSHLLRLSHNVQWIDSQFEIHLIGTIRLMDSLFIFMNYSW